MIITVFAPERNENGDQNGKVNRRVRLMGVKAPNTAVKGPNDDLFAGEGAAVVDLNNLTEAAYGEFKAGRQYKVTIEEIEPT